MVHQIYKIHWRGIDVEAGYEVASCGTGFCHLELGSINPPKARMPMTETGCRSYFYRSGVIENDCNGDVVAAVIEWFNEEEKSKKWQDFIEHSK